MSGTRSRTPVARSTAVASTAPPSICTLNPPGRREMLRTVVWRTSIAYALSSSRPRARRSRGGIPSRVRNPCSARDAELRGRPSSHTSTRRRQRPSINAALSPAGPPPTMTTSYMSMIGASARPFAGRVGMSWGVVLDVADFDFNLPDELIAQEPPAERGGSRLLVMRDDELLHDQFANLVSYLRRGDLLVVNDTRVFPARLLGHRVPSGGAVEC